MSWAAAPLTGRWKKIAYNITSLSRSPPTNARFLLLLCTVSLEAIVLHYLTEPLMDETLLQSPLPPVRASLIAPSLVLRFWCMSLASSPCARPSE
jgi:hypothetical protein